MDASLIWLLPLCLLPERPLTRNLRLVPVFSSSLHPGFRPVQPARRTDEIVGRGLEAASYDWIDAFRIDGCDKAGGICDGLRGVGIVCCRL